MKLQYITVMALAAALMTTYAELGIGDPIVDADIKMKSTDGSMVSFNDVKGEKGTLIIFTCNKCPFVEAWHATMVDLGNSCITNGIGVIFVNSNDPSVKGDTFENMQAKAKKEGYQFPYVVDATSGIAKNFGAKKTPDVFLFDAAGNLAYQGAVGDGGRQPNGTIWLKEALDALVEGETVDKSQTKAVGCSIKFR